MKAIIAVLSLLSISSTVFAADCVTSDLEKERKEWAKIREINDEEGNILLEMAKKAKVAEVITCAGLGLKINREESKFAIQELERFRVATLAQINRENDISRELLNSSSTSESEKLVYARAISLGPSRLAEENRITDSVIRSIKRATK